MNEFKKYQHVERYGTSEVNGIDVGTCYVFPKIDGTNASLWQDDELECGSRRRHLSIDADNAGFLAWAEKQTTFSFFFEDNPTLRLFGEWLVPHSLKTYRENAWRDFYVFDVTFDLPEPLPCGEQFKYLTYEEYKPLLDACGISYIPPIAIINNPTVDQLYAQLEKNDYLIEDGKGYGEGIVIKNYDFTNRYGRTTWAKIVTSEFKEKHVKEMGATYIEGRKVVEEAIVNRYVTEALIEKVYAKICLADGWSSKFIPRLLNTVYYDLIVEDSWNFVKEFKNPKIDYKLLIKHINIKIKVVKPELF